MNISVRGWSVLAGFLVIATSVALVGSPLLTAADTPSSQLTEDSLGNMLAAMGLQPKKAGQRYDFSFKAVHGEEEWELSMSAVLSQNGDSIWVMAWLDELPKSAAEVPRTALLRLLADNDQLGKGKFFAYIPSNRRFVLQRVILNHNVTTADFRAVLQDLGASVVVTHPHWNVEAWQATAAPAQTAAAPGPDGHSSPAAGPAGTSQRTAAQEGAIRR